MRSKGVVLVHRERSRNIGALQALHAVSEQSIKRLDVASRGRHRRAVNDWDRLPEDCIDATTNVNNYVQERNRSVFFLKTRRECAVDEVDH